MLLQMEGFCVHLGLRWSIVVFDDSTQIPGPQAVWFSRQDKGSCMGISPKTSRRRCAIGMHVLIWFVFFLSTPLCLKRHSNENAASIVIYFCGGNLLLNHIYIFRLLRNPIAHVQYLKIWKALPCESQFLLVVTKLGSDRVESSQCQFFVRILQSLLLPTTLSSYDCLNMNGDHSRTFDYIPMKLWCSRVLWIRYTVAVCNLHKAYLSCTYWRTCIYRYMYMYRQYPGVWCKNMQISLMTEMPDSIDIQALIAAAQSFWVTLWQDWARLTICFWWVETTKTRLCLIPELLVVLPVRSLGLVW